MRSINTENDNNIEKDAKVYNMEAIIGSRKAVFGMDGRMGLLLYPVMLLTRHIQNPKVLIVGPRTEDDIFFAKAFGLKDTIGLDLFSYSKLIDIGDIHSSAYLDNSFDVVLLGWMLPYSNNPDLVFNECKRILKIDGFLGIGIESVYDKKATGQPQPNNVLQRINSSKDIIEATGMRPCFIYDPELEKNYNCAVVLQHR